MSDAVKQNLVLRLRCINARLEYILCQTRANPIEQSLRKDEIQNLHAEKLQIQNIIRANLPTTTQARA